MMSHPPFDVNSRSSTLAGVVLFLSLIWIWRRRSAKTQQAASRRPRLGSRDGVAGRPRFGSRDGGTRPRLSSHDKKRSGRNRERMSTEEMPGILEDLNDDLFAQDAVEANCVVLGPSVLNVFYETWTPPPSWTEASRQILPKVAKHEIRCEVQLELASSKLNIGSTLAEKNTTDNENQGAHIVSVHDVSVHIQSPVEGGVLELKIKQHKEDDKWMEHTFASAHMAAQFQQDILGSQVVGKQVQNMFDALQLVHQGSIASEGKEFVLHDCEAPVPEQDENKDEGKENTVAAAVGVAWGDAMRCFSSLPSVKAILETQLEFSNEELSMRKDEAEPSSLLAPTYVNKRLMLGQVDFFRLFVPALATSSVPNNESNPTRMEQLLTWRKRVARASVMVRSYVRAMKVVNQGWHLDKQLPDGVAYLKRRLAFDHNSANVTHDAMHKNEYYEATVARDVRCDVHTPQHLTNKGASNPSPYQAYSLVGCHCFNLPPKGQDHPLLYNKDPVQALPSLRCVIESNPEVDFFVAGFYPERLRVAIVLVFCRSLPSGIDKAFDTIVSNRTLRMFAVILLACFLFFLSVNLTRVLFVPE